MQTLVNKPCLLDINRYSGAATRGPAGRDQGPSIRCVSSDLGDGSEGPRGAQLLPSLGHGLGRVLGRPGRLLHPLFDLLTQVCAADLLQTLHRHTHTKATHTHTHFD